MILRINMKTKEVIKEELSKEFKIIGGRAFTTKTIYNEVPPRVEPLSPKNKLVFGVGIFSGSGLPAAARLSIGAKSPLTGGIKESNSGGVTANKLARLGYRGLIIEEEVENNELCVLVIKNDGAYIEEGNWLIRKGNYEAAKELQQIYPSAGIISIGSAGEDGLISACISNTDLDGNQSRVNGRGGLGSVMGKKGLKAIVVDDSDAKNQVPYNKEKFQQLRKEFAKAITDAPATETYKKYGTAAMVDVTNNLGALPVNNFSRGSMEDAVEISGQNMYDVILQRGGKGRTSHSCMQGCVVQCSNVYPNERGEQIVAPLEYETIGLVGSNLGIFDLDKIARINWECNDIGIDTIEFGAAMGIAMENGVGEFGEYESVMDILKKVRDGLIEGRAVASGAKVIGKILGASRVPHVKGQGLPAYDPRGVKGLGVTYATNPMGADHTAGMTIREKMDHSNKDGQIDVSKRNQIFATGIDSLGFCYFVAGVVAKRIELLPALVEAYFGEKIKDSYLMDLGKEVLKLEKEFNLNAGISTAYDKLPDFFYEETNPDCDTNFDILPDEKKGIFNFDLKE